MLPSACSSTPVTASNDASGTDTGGALTVSNDGAGADAEGGAVTDRDGMSGEGGFDSDVDASCVLRIQPDDPPRSVVFVLTNSSSSDRYVVVSGSRCTPFAIDDFVLGGLNQVCECCDYNVEAGGPGAIVFARMPPGSVRTFTWDGRRAVPYDTPYLTTCSAGVPFCRLATLAALKASPSGNHDATFEISESAPSSSSCQPDADGGSVTCTAVDWSNTCDPDAGGSPTRALAVPFTLPATGSTTVNVAIP